MNDEQKLRLRVASEQMAAIIADRVCATLDFDKIAASAVDAADDLIAEMALASSANDYYLSHHSVQTALVRLENWGLQGGVLAGDDVPRFRALADLIAPASKAEAAPAKHPGWVLEDIKGRAWGNDGDGCDAIKDPEEGRYCSGDSDVIGMLRAFAARLWEDDENSKDAVRYRWLRDSDGAGGRIYCAMDQFEADGQCIATLLSGKQLDEAIDAAMREQGEG